jgi:uncharacterized protein with PQ loop repeat
MPLTQAAAETTVTAIADTFAWGGGAFGVLLSWPQAWRLWVQRQHAGLSLAASVLGFITPVAWVTYGVAQRSAPQIVTNLLVVLGAAAILAGQVHRARPAAREWIPLTLAGMAVTFGLFAYGAAAAVGSLAGVVTCAGILPQVVVLARERLRGVLDARGVARARWVFGVLCNLCWLVYGVLVGDAVIVTTAALVALLSAVVIALTAGQRALSRPGAPELEPTAACGAG